MNILKKLFKKNKLNSEILSLVNLQDSIIMPPDTFFENTKNKELCEQYYQEYKSILSSKKTILSIHLKDIETEDIRIYIDILTSLEIHIHDILSNSNNKSYNYEYITNLLLRLKGYTLLLKSIEEESFLRLAALSSLKSTPFLSHSKKNAIDNEISRIQIQIFNAQKDIELINLQINSCLSIIDNLKVEKNPQYYLDLRSRLFDYIHAFDFNLFKEFVDNFQNKNFLTIAQIKLEKILFTNKNILKDLEKDYVELLATTNLDRTTRIHRINKLITKYMAIKEYKRIEDKNLLYKFVEYKINSYEIDYKNHQEILNDKANYPEEKEMMKEVLFKKVSNFMQNSKVFEEYKKLNFSKRNYGILANLINNAVKNENGIYNYNRIICSPELTALTFSIDSPNKMKDFFQNYQVGECTYLPVTSLKRDIFTFDEYLPLETIMRLTENFLKNPHHKDRILKDKELFDLYQIYNSLLYTVLKPKDPSHVFDNVSKIIITGQNIIFYPELIKTYNKEMAQGKKLVFPKSLKKLAIRVDDITYNREYLKYNEFELNEGLEELTIIETSPYAIPPKVLELPTTLDYLTITIKPETIRLRDYTNSQLISNKKRLKKFLKSLMHAQTSFMSSDYPPIKNLEFKGKSSFTTFSLNIECLANGHDINCETIYNDFQNKVKEIYEKLFEVAIAFELKVPKEEANFDSLKKLENKLYNHVETHYEQITSFDDGMYIWFLQTNKKNNYKKRDELIKTIKNKILKYTYLSEALPIDICDKNKFKNYVKSFLEIKFNLITSNLSKINEPLINDSTPEEEIKIFKDSLINYFKYLVMYAPKDKILSKNLDNIIERYRGRYNYFEYLLRNTFLLRLKLSIEDPNYPEDAYKVFQNYIVKRPAGVLYDLDTERLRKSWGTNVSYAALMEHAFEEAKTYKLKKEHIEYEQYLQDLSQIYISVTPQNMYYFPKGLEWYEIKQHCEIRDKQLESNIKNKHVVFPKGLKCFKIAKSYEKTLIASLVLNKELIDLDINSIILNKIRIPPNLSFYVGTSPEITFIDYENSNILNDNYLLTKFINNYLNSVYKNRKIILESVSGKQYIIYIVEGSSEELAEKLFQKIKEKLNQSKLIRKIDK